MAKDVFKQELNWTEFQNTQLSVLRSLEKAFTNSLDVSFKINNALSKVEYAMTSIARTLVPSEGEFVEGLRKATKSADTFEDVLRGNTTSLQTMDKASKEAGKNISLLSKVSGSAVGVFKDLVKSLGGFEKIAAAANSYSNTSNQLIQNSGMDGGSVRAFRSDMMSIVNSLNTVSGSYFNAQKSYALLVEKTKGVTNDLEAVATMSKPLLLASETLNADMHSVAELFNRFYNRYRFSSSNMEEVLSEIRGNTAGNSASEVAVLKNMEVLSHWAENYAEGDPQLLETVMKRISNVSAYLESEEINSSIITSWIKKIADGDLNFISSAVSMLGMSGHNVSYMQAQDMAKSMDPRLVNSLLEGVNQIVESSGKGIGFSDILSKFGISEGSDFALSVQNALTSDTHKTFEEFLESVEKNNTPLSELVEDKFISAQDVANNWLQNIYEKIAHIQEYLPIGISDILLAATLMRSMARSNHGSPGTAGMLGSYSRAGVATTGLLGSLEMGGFNATGSALTGLGATAAGAGIALAGAAGLGYGLYSGINDIKSGNTLVGGTEIAGGLGMGAGAAALLAVGPVGWIPFLAGAVALVGSAIYKTATTIGAVGKVEEAYDEAKKHIINKSAEQANALQHILVNIKESDNLELERQKLIETGVLSEQDRQSLIDNWSDDVNSNKSALESLTNAYLKATGKWSDESTFILNKYEKLDKGYAKGLHGDLESQLQYLNDGGYLTEGSQALEAVDALFYDIMKGFENRVANGETLDKSSQSIYSKMQSAFKDGSLTQKGANSIIDAGFLNTTFQNAQLTPEQLINAIKVMSVANAVGSGFAGQFDLNSYYGLDGGTAELIGKLVTSTSREDAQQYLNELKSRGIPFDKYSEVVSSANKFGLSGYAYGSNYIPNSQLAFLHEGEAVVPKKYNPMANLNELEVLREQARMNQETASANAKESKNYLEESSTVLQEIKSFLSYWKDDNTQRELAKERREKFSDSRMALASFGVQR